MTAFTSNILKGGALIEDARRLVEVWDLGMSPEWNLDRVVDENLLAKRSRVRARDVLDRVLRPRYIDPGPHVIAALKRQAATPRGFVEACYFEAARVDPLLAAFAEGRLYAAWERGNVAVDVAAAVEWLDRLAADGAIPRWALATRTEVARHLLAALRDFGVLQGQVRKEIAPPSLSVAGFGYVAFRLHEAGASSRALVSSPVWRRWLLSPQRVTELFHAAERSGLLRYSAAGTSVRVDWLRESLAEVVGAVA